MAQTTDPMVGEFLQEATELLERLDDRGLRPIAERDGHAVLGDVELVLHTLKGNSRAFGFLELAHVASALLDRVRDATRGRDVDTWLERGGRATLLDFARVTREYLRLARDSGNPGRGFFSRFVKRLEGRDQGTTGSDAPSQSPTGASEGDDPSWAAEVAAIVDSAPPVAPRIREITDLAVRELNRERAGVSTGFFPDKKMRDTEELDVVRPAPPREVERRERSRPAERSAPAVEVAAAPLPRRASAAPAASSLGQPAKPAPAASRPQPPPAVRSPVPVGLSPAHGYAFESLRVAEAVGHLLEDETCPKEAKEVLSRACELLGSFGTWSASCRTIPVRESLEKGSRSWQEFREALGTRLRVELPREDVHWLPLLGELASTLLADTAEVVTGGRFQQSEGEPEGGVVVSVENPSGKRYVLRIVGLQEKGVTTIRLKKHSVKKRVEELGGAIRYPRRGELRLELPDNFHSIDVLLVRSGETAVGFPVHRVVEIMERDISTDPTARDGGRIVYDGQKVPLIDLSGVDTATNTEGSRVLVVKGARGCQAIKVDEVVDRGEMLVQRTSSDDPDVLGFCVRTEDGSRIPLLDMSPV